MRLAKTVMMLTSLATMGVALAQDEPPPPDQQRRRGGQQGQFDPNQVQQWQRMREANQTGSIFATDKYVYVLRGSTLYQYKASDLELVKKVQLPAPEQAQGGEPRPAR